MHTYIHTCHTIPYRTIPFHYITSRYIALHCATLHYATLHYTAPPYTTLPTQIHTCLYKYVSTYIPSYIHTYIHTYIITSLHNYIHTCTHIYIYTHMQVHTKHNSSTSACYFLSRICRAEASAWCSPRALQLVRGLSCSCDRGFQPSLRKRPPAISAQVLPVRADCYRLFLNLIGGSLQTCDT